MQTHPDRRIRRTRGALAEALVQLTSERPYDSIQVRDITDQADVGYATFYRHYGCKDDLMLAIFNEVTSDLELTAGEQGGQFFEREGSLLFEHVKKYAGMYRGILQSQAFVLKLKKLLVERIKAHLRRHAGDVEELAFPVELAAFHMVASLVGLIEWWLGEDFSLPVEEMARIYERLIIQATWYALDGKNNLALSWHA
jgi:AcrR family transcriptional regulator